MENNIQHRVGIGYDVHRLVEGRRLVIGGVEIPYSKGLLGHSDADVLLHAISDALLGAIGKGDIGEHFPDNDEKYNASTRRESILLHRKDVNLGGSDAGKSLKFFDFNVVTIKFGFDNGNFLPIIRDNF